MAGLVVLLQQFLVKPSSSRKLCFVGNCEISNLMRNKHAARCPKQTLTNEQCLLPTPSTGTQANSGSVTGTRYSLVKTKKYKETLVKFAEGNNHFLFSTQSFQVLPYHTPFGDRCVYQFGENQQELCKWVQHSQKF